MDAIKFEHVSKQYNLQQLGPGTVRSRLKSLFQKNPTTASNAWVHALQDVSFRLKRGGTLGIVGPNGAGKSTMLKMLARVSLPTSGHIEINGRLAALIELGAGLHPELTGHENISLYGSILGMTRQEIKERYDAIVEFSELGRFIPVPLKKYSSGMLARLAFSIAVHSKADILLIDEVLSVGDVGFQNKCLQRMKERIREGTTIIFVSHNITAVRDLCAETIFLSKGKVEVQGKTEMVLDRYFSVLSKTMVHKDGSGQKKAEIVAVRMLNEKGEPALTFQSGDRATLEADFQFHEDIRLPLFGFFVHRGDWLFVLSTASDQIGMTPRHFRKGERTTLRVDFQVNLLKGLYHIGTHVADPTLTTYYDCTYDAVTISVHESYSHGGVADLQPVCRVESMDVVPAGRNA